MMAQGRNIEILIKYYRIFAIEGRAWVEAKKDVYQCNLPNLYPDARSPIKGTGSDLLFFYLFTFFY